MVWLSQNSQCQEGFKPVVLSPQSNWKFPLKHTVKKERKRKRKKGKAFQGASSLTTPRRTVWPPLLVKQEIRSSDGKSISKSGWIEFHDMRSIPSQGGWGPEALASPTHCTRSGQADNSSRSTRHPTDKQAQGSSQEPLNPPSSVAWIFHCEVTLLLYNTIKYSC